MAAPASASGVLPALAHAVSGGAGAAISTVATYPLDLVTTRLKVQRQLRRDGGGEEEKDDEYAGLADAFRKIYAREGGMRALYAGLGSDVAKSLVDSFLFFLFYSWFRTRRMRAARTRSRGGGRLGALEELAVGAAASACARFFTTPISNVVTRKQTAAVMGDGGSSSGRGMFRRILAEKGVLGLWAGYSADLVLTLNPSITFFLHHTLEHSVLERRGWEKPGAAGTFLLAAVSKAIATAATYPFQTAKARMQVSGAEKPARARGAELTDIEEEERYDNGNGHFDGGAEERAKEMAEKTARAARAGARNFAHSNIFATVARIARTEGISALYDGLGGELLKAFFSHGTTMVSKDIIHRIVVHLYFVIMGILKRMPAGRDALARRSRAAAAATAEIKTPSPTVLEAPPETPPPMVPRQAIEQAPSPSPSPSPSRPPTPQLTAPRQAIEQAPPPVPEVPQSVAPREALEPELPRLPQPATPRSPPPATPRPALELEEPPRTTRQQPAQLPWDEKPQTPKEESMQLVRQEPPQRPQSPRREMWEAQRREIQRSRRSEMPRVPRRPTYDTQYEPQYESQYEPPYELSRMSFPGRGRERTRSRAPSYYSERAEPRRWPESPLYNNGERPPSRPRWMIRPARSTFGSGESVVVNMFDRKHRIIED